MRLSEKFINEMIQDINKTYGLDYFWSGTMLERNNRREGIGFDSLRELYNYLCGLRQAFWLVRNSQVKL